MLDLQTIPDYALLPKSPGLTWLGFPLPYKANCLESEGYFTKGDHQERFMSLSVQIFDWNWTEINERPGVIIYFADDNRVVSYCALHGQSINSFAGLLDDLERAGNPGNRVDIRALTTHLTFEQRKAVVDDVPVTFYAVVVVGAQMLPPEKIAQVAEFQQSGKLEEQ